MEAKLQILLTGCSAVTIILLINFVSDVMWQKRGNQDDRLKRCKLFTELVKKMKLKASSVTEYIFLKENTGFCIKQSARDKMWPIIKSQWKSWVEKKVQ